MEKFQLKEIFRRYLQNECSEDEARAIIQYFDTDKEVQLRELIREELQKTEGVATDAHLKRISDEVLQRLKQNIQKLDREYEAPVFQLFRHKPIQHWKRFSVAASLFFLLGSGIYFFTRQSVTQSQTPASLAVKQVRDTLAPGGNKAMLTLSNGQQISLDNVQTGQLAREANAVIHKTAEGKVVYEVLTTGGHSIAETSYNTLTTPRGGKYDLTLSDGTKVWLNAASSIRYPSTFPDNSRQVEITGEAYFEVVHDAKKPFRVLVAGQLIEDLGTQFNVNAYIDESAVKTTLIEGSIKVSNKLNSIFLKPGQQAIIQTNQSVVVNPDADIDEAMAWHRGLFTFNDADIQTVMRQLSRWYDVDITYEGVVPQRRFSGKIYRNINALKVADILSYKQIHFRIEGRKIIVTP